MNQERERLHCLAEPHVVGEARSEPGARTPSEKRETVALIIAQLAGERSRDAGRRAFGLLELRPATRGDRAPRHVETFEPSVESREQRCRQLAFFSQVLNPVE